MSTRDTTSYKQQLQTQRATLLSQLASLRGGQGSIVGTMLGAMLLTVLANGTVLLNVSGFWQRVIVGGVVLIAVLVDLFRRRN